MTVAQPLGPGFLGLQLYHGLKLIDEQGDEVLAASGLDLPAHLSSTLVALKRYGPMSAADLSKLLDMPHQLATQRLRHLRELEFIIESRDPDDRRRIIITLSDTGQDWADGLDQFATEMGQVYQTIFDEIGVDLHAALIAFHKALRAQTLGERHADMFPEGARND